MPTLPTQSFQTIVSNIVVGIQGRASQLLNFSIGSTLRAIAEGFGGIFLWYQAMALQLLTAIRLSTSTGSDVDTFVADFMPVLPNSITAALPNGSPRLGAQAATGIVTLTRFTAAPSVPFCPVGTQFRTFDGANTFAVTADPTDANFSAIPAPGGYTMPALTASIEVPVQNITPGLAGNAQANTITVFTSSLTGIDQVTNVAALTNGEDQETDVQLKKRFQDYILGLSRGDIYGLTAAIEGVAVGVQWTLQENYNLDGSFRPGYFFVVADDGSGTPSPQYLQSILDAVNSVRPLTVQCAVFPPTIIWATVQMQLITAATYDHLAVVAQVAATIANNINSLGLGNNLPFSILASWAYSVPGVINVPNNAIRLNSTQNDLVTTVPTDDGVNTLNLFTIKALSMVIS